MFLEQDSLLFSFFFEKTPEKTYRAIQLFSNLLQNSIVLKGIIREKIAAIVLYICSLKIISRTMVILV